ncbi:MAG: hypothetical protein QHC67_11815 [Sphingobium sp.]|uniref:hypothetical protein n=1 Tax=Sphingobium sp. TaxID=1912891 RepID=UPI0029B91314|nr:hypothetical protein [Sphingobium sp.]MDX3910494.1 hypothetical protein [Sphingobium sp.]
MSRPRLAFLFIGGMHQVLHLAPVAAEISRTRPDIAVQCFCADPDTYAMLGAVKAGMNADSLRLTKLTTPRLVIFLARLIHRRSAVKGPILAAIRWRTKGAAAIVTPERTSTALRWMGWRGPLIHFRHGAGDRAPASEKRMGAFDLIVVPGQKDVERAIAIGISPERLRIGGYVKLDYIALKGPPSDHLFTNRRPVILYNPHFDRTLSSFDVAREVIGKFAEQERYNLIFAPHVRATEDMSSAERAEWQAMEIPGRILVDLGSPRLCDMTYTQAADLYLGDVSSQLYEFLVRPRPAVFINTHDVVWEGNSRYAGWQLGEVVRKPVEILDAIDRAFRNEPAQILRQQEAVAFAFGDYRGAIGRAAAIVTDVLDAKG